MSTDYVFRGEKKDPYVEDDLLRPLNVYGVSKLAGEYFVQNICQKYFIVRTSGLYGLAGSRGKRGNFVELMLRLAQEGKEIRVVDDQVLTPTYTMDLARKIKELIAMEQFGLYHITNNGQCSWYEFAKEIFEASHLQANLHKTTTREFGARARRPDYSVLRNRALEKIGMDDLRTWKEALRAYLAARSPNAYSETGAVQ
jgi:dTDP-4-dehydrorhamnose reductase